MSLGLRRTLMRENGDGYRLSAIGSCRVSYAHLDTLRGNR